ncbi:hypothetical protein H3146_05955 [Streptomyces sp. OF3]|uniref:Uncharacterized protein n=1 Tax=Streptomyces alkaliterrae TaxID=2213162 RepID=A0A7W3ZLX7_9ACTN|nr:hypothetical protein [Streptomyces alkaliterrae]MBB1252911.1 hypothetical protein [Streptomyces alkaliterrae]
MDTLTISRRDADQLVADVEAYLARQAPRTAHPLVTAPTDRLVAEALASLPAGPAPDLSAPSRAWRWLPERAWRAVARLRPRRDVTVQQYLGLLVMVLERHGWTGAGARRTVGGCRCIAGAQELLAHLGYGAEGTADAAGRAIQDVLHRRGEKQPYWEWNDARDRRRAEVLALLREAAATVA